MKTLSMLFIGVLLSSPASADFLFPAARDACTKIAERFARRKNITPAPDFYRQCRPQSPLRGHTLAESVELCCEALSRGVSARVAQNCNREFYRHINPATGVQAVQRCLRSAR